MAKIQKLIDRLREVPRDFTWDELIKVLAHFGYMELKTGKTGGSRRKFANSSNDIVSLHQLHPGSILKRYSLEYVLGHLKEKGLI